MLDALAGCAADADVDAEGSTSTDVDTVVDSEKAQDALPGAAELAPRAMLPSEALGAQRGGTIALAPATGGGDASDRRRVMQQPQAPEKLQVEADSCPLLQLLAAPLAPEPWVALASHGVLRRLDLGNAVADEENDEDIFEALNEAAESELDDAWNRARAAVSHKGLPIVFDFLEEERLFELALVEGAPALYVGDAGPAQALGRRPRRRRAARSDAWAPRRGLEGMRVAHVAHGGAAASLEARLIRDAMERPWPVQERCARRQGALAAGHQLRERRRMIRWCG